MKILFVPQVADASIEYEFEDEKVTVYLDGESDTFDFMGLPDGKLEIEDEEGNLLIETSLPVNPILEAWREGGVLHVKLLNYIGMDANEKDRFPDWQEVG
ncbi:hypothetical protein [Halalkalibacterium halodurans]|uniref:Uncharacterized protein n=1 Tax=Halalkalibacterium halodurans TaxID=86665 RepID=A0A0M0KM54_ALKHA|nr:hypothetical protein [Halalkalibacterium halodurans]TPE70680.1 hypothetical protein AMD02_001555 [Halalkalibacterium halodurans]